MSVGSKRMRRPNKDGWYEHGQNCLEYLEHNFGGVQPTHEQSARHAQRVKARQARGERDDSVDLDARLLYGKRSFVRPSHGVGRGGYG